MREQLLEATNTIYNQIATLRRGMPIAESKARNEYERLRVRRKYMSQISELNKQYQAIWSAMEVISC